LNGERTDAELVAAARKGDARALRRLFGRYERSARERIRRRLPASVLRKTDPEDVLQEAYLVAATRLEDFRPETEDAFGRWFARIVANKIRECLRHYVGATGRTVRRELTRGARPDTACQRGRGPTPSRVASEAEQGGVVRSFLDSLRPAEREIIELVSLAGLTLREAAERLGCSREAAKKRFSRAVTALRRAMDEEAR